jgi:hypothetical protein
VRCRIDAAGRGVGILDVMIISTNDIEVLGDRISCSGPHHLHNFVTASASAASGRVGHVADSREVGISATHGEAADVGKARHGVHRIGGRRELIPFVAGTRYGRSNSYSAPASPRKSPSVLRPVHGGAPLNFCENNPMQSTLSKESSLLSQG